MKIVVLCFGSEFVDEDRLCFDLCDELKNEIKNIEFVNCMYPNEILSYINYDKIFILDVIKGIKNISIIKDCNLLKKRKISTLHDFDLGFFLEILNKIRSLKNIEIIGIPIGFDKKLAKKKIKEILKAK
jgi:Ni,Fe-hydrogenase maturation factor